MKANKLDQVKKQIPEDFRSISFNEEVSAREKGCYHILELNKVHIAAEERYVLTARVKKYNENAWNGIKEELKQLGYKHMYVLHDPTFVEKVSARKQAIQEK